MNLNIRYHTFKNYIIVAAAGCICHFVYELTGRNMIAAAIFPVDESPFQHLKLIFFPFLAYTLIRYFFKRKNMLFSSALSVIAGMLTTLAIYYTYVGITGRHSIPVDIASFFIGMFVAFKLSDTIHNRYKNETKKRIHAFVIFSLSALTLILFTYFTPDLPVFAVPA